MQTICITSGVGGVGKSTFSAALSSALSRLGQTVLLVECSPCGILDLHLGCEDRALYSLSDVTEKRVSLGEAVLPLRHDGKLLFLSEGMERISLDLTSVWNLLDAAEKECKADFTIFDAGDIDNLTTLMCISHLVVPVTTAATASIRATELLGMKLEEKGANRLKLLVNAYGLVKPYPLSEIIDATKIPLLGVLPQCDLLPRLEGVGKIAVAPLVRKENYSRGVMNIAKRLLGQKVLLFQGFRGCNRKKLIL